MATISEIVGFSTTPGSNDNLSDISLAEGWAPSTVNNALRELMSFMADSANGAAGWNVIQTTGTAGTTQTQAGALAITSPIMRISTCANSGDGVKLPTAAANLDVLIINDGAEAAQIWPNTSDTIDGGSADAVDANTLAAGSARRYITLDAVNWVTASASGFDAASPGAIGGTTPAAGNFTTLDATGDITGANFQPDGDTAAGDSAAVGYTATEGLVLTGQGSTNDITLKNDADAEVGGVLTGTTTFKFQGEVLIPNRCYVQAYLSATKSNVTGDGTAYVLAGFTEGKDVGADFDAATGIFTAPETGNYYVNSSYNMTGLLAGHVNGGVSLGGTIAADPNVYYNPYAIFAAASSITTSPTISGIYPMTAGQTLWIISTVSSSTKVVDLLGGSAHSHLEIMLLG